MDDHAELIKSDTTAPPLENIRPEFPRASVKLAYLLTIRPIKRERPAVASIAARASPPASLKNVIIEGCFCLGTFFPL